MDWDTVPTPDDGEKRNAALREHEARLHGVLATLCGTKDGRYFLRWLLNEAGAFRQEFPRDDRTGLWFAGRRSLGMQLFEQCAAAGAADILVKKEL